jgi:hypothetical protein
MELPFETFMLSNAKSKTKAVESACLKKIACLRAHLQIVYNLKYLKNALRPHSGNLAVHLIRHHTFEPHNATLHDDANGA